MQMRMLLLLPAVMLLISLTVASSAHLNVNLNEIIEDAEKYNESFTREFFVEDVSHLTHGEKRCQDVFFCKVHKILVDHKNLTTTTDVQDRLLRNLGVYIRQHIKNCSELLKDVTSSSVSIPIPEFVKHLIHCIRVRNFNN